MANRLTTNPIYLEAVAASEVTGLLSIQSIAWTHTEGHAIAANDDLTITDSAGNILLEIRQPTAAISTFVEFPGPNGLRVSGVKATELDGGEVFIYLRSRS